MSDKDFVEKAAVKGLSRKTDKKPEPSKKSTIPEKGSAEAEIHRQAALEADIHFSKPDLPQKGGAEAAVHIMAAKGSKAEHGAGFGFLALALLVPLAVIGGLYAYSGNLQEGAKSTNKTSNAKTTDPKSVPKPSTKASAKAGDKIPKITKPAKVPAKATVTPPKVSAKTVPTPPKTATKIAAKTVTKTVAKNGKPQWNYKNLNWASLDPSFKTCGTGKSQSPIDINPNNPLPGPGFAFRYVPTAGKVINNGHSIQVDLDKPAKGSPNQVLVNGKPYDLKQFHFHTPSEHTINGRYAPMEVHLVHENAQGQLAIVAVMISAGGQNQLIDKMPIPATKGDYSTSGGPNINSALLLPRNRHSFTFTGSLTTPPCTQNVGWIVLQTPLMIAPSTLAKFQKVMGNNARPVQPTNGRGLYAGH
ncbi:MAG: hypothetical protein GY927_04245 [bacterium]|nr:hypothetical protein [bacterium]